MGPGSLPSPIQYAVHYAEWMKEMILTRDDKEKRLRIGATRPERAVLVSKRPKIQFTRDIFG